MHPDTYHRTNNTVRTPLLIEPTQSSLRCAIDNEKKKKRKGMINVKDKSIVMYEIIAIIR